MSEDIQPNKLPAMKSEEVKARAQQIFDLRGAPPYSQNTFKDYQTLSDGEVAVISEFVHYWMPYLSQRLPK